MTSYLSPFLINNSKFSHKVLDRPTILGGVNPSHVHNIILIDKWSVPFVIETSYSIQTQVYICVDPSLPFVKGFVSDLSTNSSQNKEFGYQMCL